MADRVLITTDDLEHAVRINAHLETAGFQTTLASSFDDVRRAVGTGAATPDCIVLTGALHESSAAQLLRIAHDRSISTLGLVEHTDPDPKALARELGLTAFLEKPADPAEVTATVRRLIERRRLQARTGILGESPAIQEVLVKIEQMAPVSATLLIEGESGTGKELVARAIHDLSPRRGKPFIAVNCAAIPDTLLESELFGHEKGAFTGAAERRLGRFELAEGGTIFLDEVGEMSPTLQVKLLRVLQDREVRPVGADRVLKVDVRVIAASNKELAAEVESGNFREDLFYRLQVIPIVMPPLRERRSDIPLLIHHLLEKHNRKRTGRPAEIAEEAMVHLWEYDWPGNVRELENVMERSMILDESGVIGAEDLPEKIRFGHSQRGTLVIDTPTLTLEELEKEYILKVLNHTRWQKKRASEILGINASTLYRKLLSYGMDKGERPEGMEAEEGSDEHVA